MRKTAQETATGWHVCWTPTEPARTALVGQRRVDGRIDCTTPEARSHRCGEGLTVAHRMFETRAHRRTARAASGARRRIGGDECGRSGDRQLVTLGAASGFHLDCDGPHRSGVELRRRSARTNATRDPKRGAHCCRSDGAFTPRSRRGARRSVPGRDLHWRDGPNPTSRTTGRRHRGLPAKKRPPSPAAAQAPGARACGRAGGRGDERISGLRGAVGPARGAFASGSERRGAAQWSSSSSSSA